MISEILAFLAGFAACKVYVSFFVNTGNYCDVNGGENNNITQINSK